MLMYLPLPVLGSMVFVIGLGLMYEYLVLRFTTMPTIDYLIVWIITVTIALAGVVNGCLLGLGVLAKTLPFHAQLQPEALATSRGASGAKPVHVSEMFEDVCDLGTDWRPLSEMGLSQRRRGSPRRASKRTPCTTPSQSAA